MKEIRECINEIRRGKDPERNLPQFGMAMAAEYERATWIDFTMNYVLCHEMMTAGETEEELTACHERIQTAIRDNLLSGFDGHAAGRSVVELDGLRTEVIHRMEVLTAYADRLQNYEYVLNRLEAKFMEETPQTDTDAAAEEIFRYIFDSSDNVAINEKIREVLGQLPVRMTKQKFYDLLRESFTVYRGSDRSSLELYEYMIRTASMLYRPDGAEEYYGNLKEAAALLDALDTGNPTKEEYEDARAVLADAVNYINQKVDQYVILESVINNLYALILLRPYADMEPDRGKEAAEIRSRAERIIRVTLEAFEGKLPSETAYLDVVTEDLSALEGKLERRLDRISQMEAVLEEAETRFGGLIDSLMLRPVYDSLRRCMMLRSDSIFADLEEEPEEGIVTQEDLDQVTGKLISDFAEAFEGQSRMLRRAVMAAVLNKMPVFLNSRQEVLEYVRRSLECCTDPAELFGSVELLHGMVLQDGFADMEI